MSRTPPMMAMTPVGGPFWTCRQPFGSMWAGPLDWRRGWARCPRRLRRPRWADSRRAGCRPGPDAGRSVRRSRCRSGPGVVPRWCAEAGDHGPDVVGHVVPHRGRPRTRAPAQVGRSVVQGGGEVQGVPGGVGGGTSTTTFVVANSPLVVRASAVSVIPRPASLIASSASSKRTIAA